MVCDEFSFAQAVLEYGLRSSVVPKFEFGPKVLLGNQID
jgi:hypothetical protein